MQSYEQSAPPHLLSCNADGLPSLLGTCEASVDHAVGDGVAAHIEVAPFLGNGLQQWQKQQSDEKCCGNKQMPTLVQHGSHGTCNPCYSPAANGIYHYNTPQLCMLQHRLSRVLMGITLVTFSRFTHNTHTNHYGLPSSAP
jgi:hypothetical protein